MDEVIKNKRNRVKKKGKKLGERQKEAEAKKLAKQNAAKEKKASAISNKINKNSLEVRARIEEQRAAKELANKPKPRVTRKQSRVAKPAFPATQTVDEFVGLKKLTNSIKFRTSYKF